jgi:GxxExxY protein
MALRTKSYLKELTYKINGAAIEVHKQLGPGLLESIYHKCMLYELNKKGIQYQSELIIPIEYKEIVLDADIRCDIFVEESIVVELKAVEKVLPIHEAQLLTYMKLLESPQGILINFNCTNIFQEGQKTYVNEFYRNLPYEIM